MNVFSGFVTTSCLKAVLITYIGMAATAWAGAPSAVVDNCLKAASAKHGLSYELVRSIAEQESNFNPRAEGGNANGSQDFGLMQINSIWLPMLKKYGVSRQDLFDPCVSADIGSWILADNFRRMGVTWDAVGAYNAATQWKRVKYATGVYNKLIRFTNFPHGQKVASKQVVRSQPQMVSNEETSTQNRQIASYEVQP